MNDHEDTSAASIKGRLFNSSKIGNSGASGISATPNLDPSHPKQNTSVPPFSVHD